jgi:DNA-binding transcriptional LysR family regulator
MEWSDVKVFLAVARAGSLGAAARELGITQPTVGRRLKALESAVGGILFQRTTAGFILTPAGELVLTHARRMEVSALDLQRQLAGSERELAGPLRVSCSDWFGVHIVAPIVAEFTRIYPNVEIELLTESRFADLARREADLAFRIQPFTAPGIASRKLMRIRYGLYLRDGDPPPTRGGAHATRLITMNESFVAMPDVSWLKERFPNAAVTARSNNREVQAMLCSGGGGLAVLPTLLATRFPTLRRIDVDDEPPGRDTWAGYHRDLRRLPRLRALLDFIVSKTKQVGKQVHSR